jgi:hypothetical protein
MPEEPRNWWSKFDIITRAIGVILLPVVLLIASNKYATSQRSADDLRYGADRLAAMSKSLASNDSKERLIALETLQGTVRSNPKLIETLSPVLQDFADHGSDDERRLAAKILQIDYVQENRATINDDGPRLYLDICKVDQIGKAEEAKGNLEREGFNVLAIGSVPVGPPETTQVRYFHSAERNEAQRIAAILTKVGLRNAKEVYFEDYPSYPRRQYEVRFSVVALAQ